MKNIEQVLKSVDAFINENQSNERDEIISIVISINNRVESVLRVVGEYTEIMDYDVFFKDCSETDNCGNFNRTIYSFEYENGRFRQSMSLSGGSDCWNTYYGNYLDVLNNEELLNVVNEMVLILEEALEILKKCREDEIRYEKAINKILFKNDFKKLCKLSKEYCIII